MPKLLDSTSLVFFAAVFAVGGLSLWFLYGYSLTGCPELARHALIGSSYPDAVLGELVKNGTRLGCGDTSVAYPAVAERPEGAVRLTVCCSVRHPYAERACNVRVRQ